VKDYYQILRISRHASAEEIKRAFRRLAVLFHPDKNHSPDAIRLFQEINEAYQVLSDPFQRQQYDNRNNSSFVVSSSTGQPVHRDPAYRRRRPPGYQPPTRQPSERLLMMIHFLKYLRTICLTGIACCAVLLIDFYLPFRISDERVLAETEREYSWQFHHVPNILVTDKKHQFEIPEEGVSHFPVGSLAHISSSRLLHVLARVESEDRSYAVANLSTIYSTFMFVPIVLFVFCAIGLRLKEGIEFRFSWAIAILMFMLFNFIFLIVSIL
jgi:hypothetical protein